MGILKEMKSVDDIIMGSVNSGIPSIEQVANHVINAGGKRIRPAVLLTAYNALNGENIEKAISLAAAFELVHTGTLVHDDINDRSCMRRGIPTAHTKFG
ncbi:MAG: polyprenyl synthetase family protein, partial [Candidatus Heimdallarchaeota archaeon]|nr:polyprenyl synthetase family protein [Candidatus Heimdallarchaeota archaeon]